MSDLSTIRREAVERLARAEFEDNHRSEIAVFGWTWDGVAESMRDTYRLHAGRLVRALGDLLPTGVEWGVYLDGMGPPNPFHTSSESAARSLLDTQDDHVVRKYTHDWIEVTE